MLWPLFVGVVAAGCAHHADTASGSDLQAGIGGGAAWPNVPIPEVSLPDVTLPPLPNATNRQSGDQAESDRQVASLDPAKLVGLNPDAIGALLGKPSDSNNDAMATRWTYKVPSCSLNIFFYPDLATGALRALKYSIDNMREGRNEDRQECVRRILQARQNGNG